MHDKLASILDKVVVFTEIIAPGVTIVPMCCVRASEANLTFDNELKTTLVSRNKGHYFVNCLSRRFREQCLPFEVEFPVFRIEITEKGSQKDQRLYDLLKNAIPLEEFAQEAYGEVYGKKFIEYARSQEDAYQLPLKPLSLEPKMGQAKTAFPKTTIHLDSNFDITIFGGEGYVVKGKDEESGLNYYTLYFEKER